MSPRAIARWRFEQIAPLLDSALLAEDRVRLVEGLVSSEVRWPSGAVRPLSAATLYRWARLYRERGFDALVPLPRRDRGELRAIKPAWVERAMALLRERPERSLFMLQKLLDEHVSRSTLHRHLRAQPGYARLRLRAKGDRDRRSRLHRRFEARAPHVIWQADAKGPFPVRLGTARVLVHVLTILDDKSRAVLAAIVSRSVDLAAAVRAFRTAAARFGLPEKLYCDRASIFDSLAFRTGLAELGVHRIRTRPRRPPARGKIEAYHRSLGRWFVGELRHQVVHSLSHLEELLLGTIEILYQDHPHGTLRTTPRKALAGRISERRVPLERLEQAFFQVKRIKAHPKTGELVAGGRSFRLPTALASLAGRKVTVVYDPSLPSGRSSRTSAPDGARRSVPSSSPHATKRRPSVVPVACSSSSTAIAAGSSRRPRRARAFPSSSGSSAARSVDPSRRTRPRRTSSTASTAAPAPSAVPRSRPRSRA